MKIIFKYFLGVIVVFLLNASCSNPDYKLGDLTAPSNLTITTEVVGATTAMPNGDGSGDVKITLSASNALSYKIDYDASTPLDLVYLPTGAVTKKYTNLGLNTYKITAVAYGKGGTSTTITKDVTVRSDFTPAPSIISNLLGSTNSKTWVVDKSVAGHFGVGPWSNTSLGPEWWSASVNEKVSCCNCFYTATFTFAKAADGTYTLKVTSPDGVFTKTGSNATLPGIPGSGDEGCYAYTGGTNAFSFIPSSTGVPSSASTKTAILLAGNNTFIGYGSLQKEYEIMTITSTYLYLRVQGTETGNAWYLKLKPV